MHAADEFGETEMHDASRQASTKFKFLLWNWNVTDLQIPI